MTTDLLKLAEAEATNFNATSKHLGDTARLVGDVESIYKVIPSLVKSPGGSIDSSDDLLAFLTIIHESRMCEILLTKGALAAMRMYRGDAFLHLRRAIESCAFAVRISKHHELSRVWAEGTIGDDVKYTAYRKAFRTAQVFPDDKHPDYDPALADLKNKFDLCSKLIHGSPLGIAGHFTTLSKEDKTTGRWHINFFDMPQDAFVSSFFHILGTHCMIVNLFGRMCEPYAGNSETWSKKYVSEYQYVAERVKRHFGKWSGNIAALNVARNKGKRGT